LNYSYEATILRIIMSIFASGLFVGSFDSAGSDPAAKVAGVDPVEAGGGVVVPVTVIGISPARAQTERTHVKAIAITKRFILNFLL
jgi:hypothetical protein